MEIQAWVKRKLPSVLDLAPWGLWSNSKCDMGAHTRGLIQGIGLKDNNTFWGLTRNVSF